MPRAGSQNASPPAPWPVRGCVWPGLALWLLGLLLFQGRMPGAEDAPVPASATEPAVKALTLLKLLPRVQWPTNAFAATNAPLVIVAVASPEIADELASAAKDLVIEGHPVQVRSELPDDWSGVHVAFVGRNHVGGLRRILPDVRERPILLVGETEAFVGAGGMVSLQVRQRRIRIEIAREAATAVGIRFGSSLGTLRSIDWVRPPQRP